MQWNLDSLRKAVLNSILAYAAKFYLKYLGPAVSSAEICQFLSACPGFCAWTVLITWLNRSWWFYWWRHWIYDPLLLLAWSLVSLFQALLRACCPHYSQAQVSINSSWKTPRLGAEVPDTANVSVAVSQNTDLYIHFAWEVPGFGFVSVQKPLEVENYIIRFALMNYFLPTKCVFLSRSMTLNVMKMN